MELNESCEHITNLIKGVNTTDIVLIEVHVSNNLVLEKTFPYQTNEWKTFFINKIIEMEKKEPFNVDAILENGNFISENYQIHTDLIENSEKIN